ncbi:MAG: macro domain-containing protein, partial [Lachnospiraceae bacterium]|nr:macro domain-containing protein [Lachnospiraceae bacterium]
MAFKIVRNDITKMDTEAIVNTANDRPVAGPGCDSAIYAAAGYDELLSYRSEKIGYVPEGEVFLTPGFNLPAKYIIHAVSPLYKGGNEGEEEKLRSCYRKSLQLAKENGIRSIAFPLMAAGSFGYPREEAMRIAVDEINAFLLNNDMDIRLVVFDDKAKDLGRRIYPGLEEYIDQNYVEDKKRQEYGGVFFAASAAPAASVSKDDTFGFKPAARSKPALGSIFKKDRKAKKGSALSDDASSLLEDKESAPYHAAGIFEDEGSLGYGDDSYDQEDLGYADEAEDAADLAPSGGAYG